MSSENDHDSHSDTMKALLGLGVKPLKQDKVAPYRKPIAPIPRQRLLDNERVMQELLEESDETVSYESGDELKFLRSGFSTRLLKKLRRGDYAIQDELDLQGRNSPGRVPVIKNMLIGWLSKNQHVIAVVSTPANDGGAGAVYVLLNKK